MKCKYCGNEFTPKTRRNIYCSRKCRRADSYYKCGIRHKICETCGQEYQITAQCYKASRYCSQACRKIANCETKKLEDVEITPTTVYLAHKWMLEGIKIPEIAAIQGRSIEGVKQALAMPLNKTQRALLGAYLVRKTL